MQEKDPLILELSGIKSKTKATAGHSNHLISPDLYGIYIFYVVSFLVFFFFEDI